MAAGFITKPLATLLATAARWVEFADGSTAPTHGSIQIDPATGLPLDPTVPTPVSSATLAAASQLPSSLGPQTAALSLSVVPVVKKVQQIGAWAPLDLSVTTPNISIIGAASGQTTRVHALILSAAGAVDITINDSSSAIFKVAFPAAGGPIVFPFEGEPYFVTSVNSGLTVTLSAAVRVVGAFKYIRSA